MFKKILVANRGEIACRVISTCKRLGIKTVAVYSEADNAAKHTRMADFSVLIGGSEIKNSYLSAESILKACLENSVDAVHPGYGFLSEDPEFANLVTRNGIKFVGPNHETIRVMGMKDQAKDIAAEADIAIIPGYHGNIQSSDFLHNKALEVGFPLLIKPRAGGGGKGMRLVSEPENFIGELKAARSESLGVFGDDNIILEKFYYSARHIEVQIFADNFGNVIHTFERECSIQRRYQKLIEEAPATFIEENIRKQLYGAAVRLTKAIGYSGAGTVEFLLVNEKESSSDKIFFMEMNTRLQVEHPVSEAITGLDFVELQLNIAAGKKLNIKQEEVTLNGHSIESRIYAEDPENEFMPSVGKIYDVAFPSSATYFSSGKLRFDHAIFNGMEITPFYDPMIAKLIVHGDNRDDAIAKSINALSQTSILGIATNTVFLSKTVSSDSFLSGAVDINFLSKNLPILVQKSDVRNDILAAAVIKFFDHLSVDKDDPWLRLRGWNNFDPLRRKIEISVNDQDFSISYSFDGFDCLRCAIDDSTFVVKFKKDRDRAIISYENVEDKYRYNELSKNSFQIFHQNEVFRVATKVRQSDDVGLDLEKTLRANLPGVVKSVSIAKGDYVVKGDLLLILEAMKMEQQILSPVDGIIKAISAVEGLQVSENDILIELEM